MIQMVHIFDSIENFSGICYPKESGVATQLLALHQDSDVESFNGPNLVCNYTVQEGKLQSSVGSPTGQFVAVLQIQAGRIEFFCLCCQFHKQCTVLLISSVQYVNTLNLVNWFCVVVCLTRNIGDTGSTDNNLNDERMAIPIKCVPNLKVIAVLVALVTMHCLPIMMLSDKMQFCCCNLLCSSVDRVY